MCLRFGLRYHVSFLTACRITRNLLRNTGKTLKGAIPQMEFFTNLTDDQFALIGCFIALAVSGTLMSLSYFVGRHRVGRHRTVPRTKEATGQQRKRPSDLKLKRIIVEQDSRRKAA